MSTFGMKIGHVNPRLYNRIYCVIPGVEMSWVKMSPTQNSSGVQKVYHRNMLRVAGKRLEADFSIKPNRSDTNRQTPLALQPIIVRHIEPATNSKLDVRQLNLVPPWSNINHKRFAANTLAGHRQDEPNTELLRQSTVRTHSGRISIPAKRFQAS